MDGLVDKKCRCRNVFGEGCVGKRDGGITVKDHLHTIMIFEVNVSELGLPCQLQLTDCSYSCLSGGLKEDLHLK